MQQVYKQRFGKWLTIVVGISCAIGLIGLALSDRPGVVWEFLPWLILVSGTCWALYWNPEVRVDVSGVQVRNILRTITVPWPAIEEIETRFALTLVTPYGKVNAWAAPAPGRHSVVRNAKRDLRHLPNSSVDKDGRVRPSDIPTSPSGEAATAIRLQWEELRAAGHLDNPQLEFDRLPTTWHLPTIVGGFLTVIAIVATMVF